MAGISVSKPNSWCAIVNMEKECAIIKKLVMNALYEWHNISLYCSNSTIVAFAFANMRLLICDWDDKTSVATKLIFVHCRLNKT